MPYKRKAVNLMKCQKCGINLLEHVSVCPFCKTPVTKGAEAEAIQQPAETYNAGKYASVDPNRDSYDFDLQYTLTFRDSGEIKKAIADMDAGVSVENDNSSEKTKNGPRYSLEEMQAAALRAQERRARRKSGEPDNKNRVTRTEKSKKKALYAAKERKQSSYKGLFFGIGVLAVVVALIVMIVNICAVFSQSTPEHPVVYTKGNSLYAYYGGKEDCLTENFITQKLSEISESTDTKASSDPKIAKKPTFKEDKFEANFFNVSKDGTAVYFLENVNMNTCSGDLVYYKLGKKKSRTVIEPNVYYDVVIGNDNATILFLKNATNGENGELCWYNPKEKGAKTIDSGINARNFKLSQNCLSTTYLRNFDNETYSGDLCYTALGAEQSKRVDERVSFVFGTTPKSNVYFYAKNYDKKTGTYDLYIQSDAEGPKMLAEKGFLAPVISAKTEVAFVYSDYKNKLQTLSCVDLTTGANTKIAQEITQIIKIRNDDGAVIYSKSYETDKADYYFANAKSPNPQKVATAVNISSKLTNCLFDASDDFTRVAYIGGFDAQTNRGALYTLAIINDYSGSEMRISDDAYSCDVSADGAVVRFATSYDPEKQTISLVSYANSNTLTLADGVRVFTFDEIGEYTIYSKNLVRREDGKSEAEIESVNKKGRIKKLEEVANGYGLKKDGTVLVLTTEGEGDTAQMVLSTANAKGGKLKKFATGVTKVISY